MSKFFRISGVIFFLGTVVGFFLMFSSAASDSLFDTVLGLLIAFSGAAMGLLFIYVAELLERVAHLEKALGKKKDNL